MTTEDEFNKYWDAKWPGIKKNKFGSMDLDGSPIGIFTESQLKEFALEMFTTGICAERLSNAQVRKAKPNQTTK